jgi:hypothetical protein
MRQHGTCRTLLLVRLSTMKMGVTRRVVSSGMLRRVDLVRTDVSDELSASFIKVTRIGELGTTLSVTSNRRTLRRNTKRSSEISVYLRTTWLYIPEDGSIQFKLSIPSRKWRH